MLANRTHRPPEAARVVVLGLGRFGSSLAQELIGRGWEVLGIDHDPRIVQDFSDDLTHAATADSTDIEALRQLGIPEFRRAVVGMGSLEASVLTTSLLADLGVPNVWAKAVSWRHARILERVGAHHVTQPEHDMGLRVAHLVTGRMLDYIPFEGDFALVKTRAPSEIAGKALGETGIRKRYGVTVVSIKRGDEGFDYATPETVVEKGDVLIVAGKSRNTERFADLS